MTHLSPDENDWQAWRQRRHDELSGPDSWLGLAGLFWLAPGPNTVGSAADATVVLPHGPAQLGEISNVDGVLRWTFRESVASATDAVLTVDEQPVSSQSGVAGKFLQVDLKSDAQGAPTVLGFGDVRFFVIARDGRFAVRVKNRAWANTQPFLGLESFPFAAEWIVAAEWQVLAVPQNIEVPSVTGELKAVEITHRAVFKQAGKLVELLPLSIDAEGVFFVFRDRTSGKISYGGGRFLRAALPKNGAIQLDFNRAYNPPCAFSPFATCPLPPPENWLGFAVEAGEKRYVGH